MWQGRDGFKMNGTNGSQLWDTAFMVQALVESGQKDEFADVFRKSHDFVDLYSCLGLDSDHLSSFRPRTARPHATARTPHAMLLLVSPRDWRV